MNKIIKLFVLILPIFLHLKSFTSDPNIADIINVDVLKKLQDHKPQTFNSIFQKGGYRDQLIDFSQKYNQAAREEEHEKDVQANKLYIKSLGILSDIEDNAIKQIKISTPLRNFLANNTYLLSYPKNKVDLLGAEVNRADEYLKIVTTQLKKKVLDAIERTSNPFG